MSSPSDREPLLPPPAISRDSSGSGSSARTTRLSGRRISSLGLSDKAKGKQRAPDLEAGGSGAVIASPDGSDGGGHLTASPVSSRRSGFGSGAPSRAGSRPGFREVGSDDEEAEGGSTATSPSTRRGRCITIIFSNEHEVAGGNLEVWVEEGETVGKVKDQIRALRPALAPLSLRLIHSGRLLTDGILLLPWLRQLEDRIKRQAAGMSGELESMLKEVGLSDDPSEGKDAAGNKGKTGAAAKVPGEAKVYLHCNVGPRMDVKEEEPEEEEAPAAPRRRGFDSLLDAGLSAADVAQMRRQFYESRGEEVPDDLGLGDGNDEHARALEEQWIEGDLTAETATTTSEGMFSSILYGLLAGFLYPILPLFFFRELPHPNFFDAEAEAIQQAQASAGLSSQRETGGARQRSRSTGVASSGGNGIGGGGGGGSLLPPSPITPGRPAARANPNADNGQTAEMELLLDLTAADRAGGEVVPSSIFDKRMQMGIMLGLIINIAFGGLRFLN